MTSLHDTRLHGAETASWSPAPGRPGSTGAGRLPAPPRPGGADTSGPALPWADAPVVPVAPPAPPAPEPPTAPVGESTPALTAFLHRQRWTMAQRAERDGDAAACLDHCLAVLALDPADTAARLLAARAARGNDDWRLAAALLGELLDHGELHSPALDWQRITAATVAGDGHGVAASAARLGLDPADWAGSDAVVLVVIDDRLQVARRTGPASAVIDSISGHDHTERFGDVVAFEPTPVGFDASGLPVFDAVALLTRGDASVWAFEGVEPGFDVWSDTVDILAGYGWVLRRADGTATAARPIATGDRSGLLGWLAVPARVTAEDASAVFAEAVAAWPALPICR